MRRDGVLVESYEYDVNGNRTRRQVRGNPPETASYDSQDRLLQQGPVVYQFDSDGYLAQRGSDTFRYSARGELLTATLASGIRSATPTMRSVGVSRAVIHPEPASTCMAIWQTGFRSPLCGIRQAF